MYDVYSLVFALYQAIIMKCIAVPPQLGVARVLAGRSLLVEAYHPQKKVLGGVFAMNALQLLEAVRLQVEQWIHEVLLLVSMR